MLETVNKICIIGGSGTGKTTLADNLGRVLNLPVTHIDGIHHLKNWKVRDKDERDRIILEKISQKKWIIDGTYSSTLKQRIEKAERIIYLDYSSIAQVKGALGRYIKMHGKDRSDMPGCKEKISFSFLKWVWNWRKVKRPKVLEALNKVSEDKVIIFKNRRNLNKWFKKEFNKRIIP